MKTPILAPSLLSADFCNLERAIKQIEEGGGAAVHIDVMDGQFVPEITYGEPVVRSIRKLTKLPFDVHLMTEHPERQIELFAAAGADDQLIIKLREASHRHMFPLSQNQVPVDFIAHHDNPVLPADIRHRLELFPGPDPAYGVVGTAEKQHGSAF